MADTAVLTHSHVTLTESAANRIKQLIEDEGNPNLMLRIAISGGGCSGFQYGITLDDQVSDDDQVDEQHGVKLVVDEVSQGLLGGAVIDFVEDLMGASFKISNPNAASSCGCGNSFSV